MLLPKRVKYRRVQRGRMKGKALRGNKVTYGDFGLQALEPAWITSNQIEAARVAMTRYCKRFGKVWIKIFPDKPVTQKPAETRYTELYRKENGERLTDAVIVFLCMPDEMKFQEMEAVMGELFEKLPVIDKEKKETGQEPKRTR